MAEATRAAREPFYLGRLEKAQRKAITDLIGVRARYPGYPFTSHSCCVLRGRIREDGASNQELI